MSQFLDMLKMRLADSQQRLQVVQVKLQQAQQEHQIVMQEFASWQNAVAVESRREEGAPSPPTAVAGVTRVLAAGQPAVPSAPVAATPSPAREVRASQPEPNKSAMIRDVLKQRPNGITPADLWREVKDYVPRPYVYSVLKRMKDKKQVSERRGKYFLLVVAKTEEETKEAHSAVQ